MEAELLNYRNAGALLDARRDCWQELQEVVASITAADLISKQEEVAAAGGRPAGGQTALNAIFRERMVSLGWESEPFLFSQATSDYAAWKMDFLQDRIGVEVAFNHAEAIPWTFTRLHLAGESSDVREDHRIDVGIAIFAKKSLKAWARMDGAVGTYEKACLWLQLMRSILPVPIMVVGLDAAGWAPVSTDIFRGTKKKAKTKSP